MVTFLMTLTDP